MALTTVAADVFRDYNLDGVPSSGAHNPKKPDIRRLLGGYEQVINAFTSAGGLIYDTRALLNADLAKAANSLAWVITDATAANNGVYKKVGASGTGSWSRVADLPYSFIVAEDAGAGTANAIEASTSLPVSSSALVLLNIFETSGPGPVTIRFNGAGPVYTIKTASGNDPATGGLVEGAQVLGRVSGEVFRLYSDQVSSAIVAQAEAAAAAAVAAAAAAVEAAENVETVAGFDGLADEATVKAGTSTSEAPSVLTLVQRLKYDGYLSVRHFGVKLDGTDESVALDAALAEGVPLKFPNGDVSIFEPLAMRAYSGIVGSGENTRFVRRFTGGPVIEYDLAGSPIILQDFTVTTETGRTAAAGDDGIKLGYFSGGWAQRGHCDNLRIEKQYDGFSWKRGSDGTFSNILSQLNERHGFYGVNPRGVFYRCQANYNKVSGYRMHYDDGGEAGVDFDLCRTFCNQQFGWDFSAEAGITGANFNGHRLVTSFDGYGGIRLQIPFTQFMLFEPLCEYHGWAKRFVPDYAQLENAAGLLINNANITKASLNGGKFGNNKGVGIRISGAEVDLSGPIRIFNNGRGSVAGSGGGGTAGVDGATPVGGAVSGNTAGLELTSTAKVFGGNIKFTDDVGLQVDFSIASSNVTGSLRNIEAADFFDAGGGSLRVSEMSGAAGNVLTVASAATITLPRWGEFFKISGTTQITTINGGWAGRRITLTFLAAGGGLADSGQLALAGAYAPTAFDSITLYYDGANWFEVAKSGDV